MNKYNFDNVANRRNTSSLKWNVLNNELPMWVADMDFKTLPEVCDVLKKRINIGAFGYSEVNDEYFKAYVDWWKRRHNVKISINNLAFSCGVIASLDVILKTLFKKNDKIMLFSPNYNVFYSCIKNNNMTLLPYDLEYEDYTYKFDLSKIEAFIKINKPKGLILCNPHNPIGKIFTKHEIDELLRISNENNVLIISDEIHCDIVKPGCRYYSVLNNKKYNNVIALLSPTKSFNLAGLHTSAVCSFNKELLTKIQNALYKEDVGEPNFFATYAAIAAYNYGDEYIDELNVYIENNKRYLTNFINVEIPLLHVINSDATYLIWIDVSNTLLDGDRFTFELRKETGLYVSNGSQYGKNGKQFIRINVATSFNNVKECAKRLKSFIEKIK